jgi:glycosyltransferase involved in cell wall biosynthesis
VLAERFPAGPDRPARVLVRNLVPRPEAEALARAAGAHVALVLFAPGPANHEAALPHKLFEAMALGLPVVVAETCRPAAVLVRRTGCGLVVDAADPASVAAALEALAADPRLRAHLGAAGRRALTADYAWEDDAARLASLHRRLARPREEAPAHPARPSSGTRHPWPR